MGEFNRNLKKLRLSNNLTMEELANDLNKKYNAKINKGMISKWERGNEASLSHAKILADYFKVSLNDLIGLYYSSDSSSEMVKEETTTYHVDELIPVLGVIAAGEPILAEQNIISYAPAPPMVKTKGRRLFYLKIKGNSMNREFEDGSFVLVDRDLQVENGDIAAVIVNGNEATVKKVTWKDNYLTLIPLSYDDSYLPEFVDLEKEEATIIGKVIGAYKEY